MRNVKAGRDLAGERVVAIERDRAEDAMMMPGRLACGDDCRSVIDGLNDAAGDGGVGDALDQNVALCAQTDHGSNLQ